MRAVSNSIHLSMNPESAIGLFLDEKHLQGWWRVEGCLVEPRAGGERQRRPIGGEAPADTGGETMAEQASELAEMMSYFKIGQGVTSAPASSPAVAGHKAGMARVPQAATPARSGHAAARGASDEEWEEF